VDGAGRRDQTDPVSLPLAEILIPGSAATSDQGGERETLDVLEQRRPAANTAFERPRRGRGRPGVTGIDEIHRRRFLAGHVTHGCLDDPDPPADVRGALTKGGA